MKSILLLLLLAVFLLPPAISQVAPQWQDHSVEIADQEMQVRRFTAQGSAENKYLILWLTPGFGEAEREYQLASELAQRGVEVWYLDLAESLFLPTGTSTLRAMDGRYVAGLIRAAHEQTGKKIILVTHGYGSLPALRGARLWQQDFYQDTTAAQKPYFSGAILFSPELYSYIGQPGVDPVYDPIASASNIPVMLYQAGKRGNRWQLEKNLAQLQAGGAQVYLKVLPGVTGVFYKKDTSAETMNLLKVLPEQLINVMRMLDKVPLPDKVATLTKNNQKTGKQLSLILMPYKGNPKPNSLNLDNSKGEHVLRNNYRGKVTLVNFWASWCGPCVEEIPSLNRLRKQMKDLPFELISVNYAEDRQHIAEFLKQVKVDFPVLLDSDGRVASQWKVLVFPATFVIGRDGKIVYGVNGAIYWDSPEVINTLKALTNKSKKSQ